MHRIDALWKEFDARRAQENWSEDVFIDELIDTVCIELLVLEEFQESSLY